MLVHATFHPCRRLTLSSIQTVLYIQQEKHHNKNLFSKDYTKTPTGENCDKSLLSEDYYRTISSECYDEDNNANTFGRWNTRRGARVYPPKRSQRTSERSRVRLYNTHLP